MQFLGSIMIALRSIPRLGRGNALRILAMGLVMAARTKVMPLCLGFGDFMTDKFITELGVDKQQLAGQQHSTIIKALYFQSECSNELLECRERGPLPDPTNAHCFSLCSAANIGCRSCCLDNTCYQPSGDDGSLGSCTLCEDDQDDEQCAHPFCVAYDSCAKCWCIMSTVPSTAIVCI
jgi:hypothetical protein